MTPDFSLTCFACGAGHDPTTLQTVCESCGMPLRVDLALTEMAPGSVIDETVSSMWRYGSVLSVDPNRAVTLGEGWTPLEPAGDGAWVKDEAPNPTGSFKARGMSMAVSAAVARGASRLTAPSAGNAAVALAVYGQAADVAVAVAMPEDTPGSLPAECCALGAEVQLVPGTISDAGRWLTANRRAGDFDVSTLREPYRIEGKKTMAYELYEQLDRSVPDVVIYPTGGGTGLIGMWKAWGEMRRMGWIARTPRMVSVQAEGCAPVVRAYASGDDVTLPWEEPRTEAFGLRVPVPLGGFICLQAIRQTQGTALAVSEDGLHEAARSLATVTGLDICPEGGAAWAAYLELKESGWIGPGENVVVFNTGAGSKYV